MLIHEVLLFALFLIGNILLISQYGFLREYTHSHLSRAILITFLRSIGIFLVTCLLINFFTKSLSISIPIAFLAGYLPRIQENKERKRMEEARRKSWPLVIDQLASATQSGVPLHQAFNSMQDRGPAPLKGQFAAFSRSLREEGSFEKALEKFVESAHKCHAYGHDEIAVKVKTTLLIARDCGGLEVGPILRNLGALLRQRERALNEVAVKQEWIKNGAALAAATPWLLLILLSLNQQTRAAYDSSGGRIMLLIGFTLTLLAYLWISKISLSVSQVNRLR
jgi:tight adherence protein B